MRDIRQGDMGYQNLFSRGKWLSIQDWISLISNILPSWKSVLSYTNHKMPMNKNLGQYQCKNVKIGVASNVLSAE